MAEHRAGTLREGPRAELVGGRIEIPERPAAPQAAAILALEDRFRKLSLEEEGVLVKRSPPLRLGPTDLLRPDLALLIDAEVGWAAGGGRRHDPHGNGKRAVAPGVGGSYDPAAALLVVEVSRGRVTAERRSPRYAAAGVQELWLIDLKNGWIEALRAPSKGAYRSRTLWYPGEKVPVVSLAGVMVEALAPP